MFITHVLEEMQNGMATLEEAGNFLRANVYYAISSTHSPRYISNRSENCVHKNLHVNVYSSFIHIYPK